MLGLKVVFLIVMNLPIILNAQYLLPQIGSEINYTIKVRDTAYYSHSKFNPISEGCRIYEYEITKDDYLNIQKGLSRDSILNRYPKHILELVPDYFGIKSLHYDPNSLFCIYLKQEYDFAFPIIKYKIEKEELSRGIFIKERIPNAHKHFRKAILRLEFIKAGKNLHKIESYDSYINSNEYKVVLDKIDTIKVSYFNNYECSLKIIFTITEN